MPDSAVPNGTDTNAPHGHRSIKESISLRLIADLVSTVISLAFLRCFLRVQLGLDLFVRNLD